MCMKKAKREYWCYSRLLLICAVVGVRARGPAGDAHNAARHLLCCALLILELDCGRGEKLANAVLVNIAHL